MVAFDNPWYAEMIERFSPDSDEPNGTSARAILAGFCILATAVDGLADQCKRVGAAITPNIVGGKDAMGGHVESLTEGVMGITAALTQIANAMPGDHPPESAT